MGSKTTRLFLITAGLILLGSCQRNLTEETEAVDPETSIVMETLDSLFEQVEDRWRELATEAIVETIDAEPSADLYVAGFWLFYADYTMLGAPNLALSTEKSIEEIGEDCRWTPPDWRVDVHDCGQEMQPLYQEISNALAEQPEDVWESAIQTHYEVISRVCLSLTEEYHAGSGSFQGIRKNDNFVVGIFEDYQGDEVYDYLLNSSIDPARKASLEGL